MASLEEEIDLHAQKFIAIEQSIESAGKNIVELQDAMLTLSAELKETQKFLIKLAQNQALVSKQVAQWPYVTVPMNNKDTKPRNKRGDAA